MKCTGWFLDNSLYLTHSQLDLYPKMKCLSGQVKQEAAWLAERKMGGESTAFLISTVSILRSHTTVEQDTGTQAKSKVKEVSECERKTLRSKWRIYTTDRHREADS